MKYLISITENMRYNAFNYLRGAFLVAQPFIIQIDRNKAQVYVNGKIDKNTDTLKTTVYAMHGRHHLIDESVDGWRRGVSAYL